MMIWLINEKGTEFIKRFSTQRPLAEKNYYSFGIAFTALIKMLCASFSEGDKAAIDNKLREMVQQQIDTVVDHQVSNMFPYETPAFSNLPTSKRPAQKLPDQFPNNKLSGRPSQNGGGKALGLGVLFLTGLGIAAGIASEKK